MRREPASLGEAQGAVQVLRLDFDRRELASVGEPHPAATSEVVADLADGTDRVLECEVAPRARVLLEHSQHDRRRADLEERRVLAHVGVADDHVQAPEAFGVGVRLVPGVDDRSGPGRRARDALPDVLGPLAHAVHGPTRGLEDLAGAGIDLSCHEERDQDIGELGEVAVALDEIVLVAPVGVAGGVGVVLEQEHLAPDALLPQALLGTADEALEDALTRLVVDDEIVDRVALGRGVLGVAADVEVEPGAVLEEHVAGAAPRNDPPEQVASNLVRAQAPLPAKRAGDAVLVLQTEDSTLHTRSVPALD